MNKKFFFKAKLVLLLHLTKFSGSQNSTTRTAQQQKMEFITAANSNFSVLNSSFRYWCSCAPPKTRRYIGNQNLSGDKQTSLGKKPPTNGNGNFQMCRV
jgi:hypothetical protein